MNELREFLQKNKEKIHDLLNFMWSYVERTAIRLSKSIPNIDLENSHGNYISLRDGWVEAVYANPCLIFKHGEFGYSLDGPYCVFALKSEALDEETLNQLFEKHQKHPTVSLELYGGDDCFETYFESSSEAAFDEILQKIHDSSEEIVQLELTIPPLSEEEMNEDLIELTKKLYDFLAASEKLADLTTYLLSKETTS
ncbi:MAG: DUF3201 domain-containing protein [Asgard group archaeon]|nr:DUF3201 domain-containing protein [Asgard group archaeon]